MFLTCKSEIGKEEDLGWLRQWQQMQKLEMVGFRSRREGHCGVERAEGSRSTFLNGPLETNQTGYLKNQGIATR